MVAIADKDKAHREGFFALDDSDFHTQQILRAATPLAILLVDCLHILQASLMEIVYLFRLLCHGALVNKNWTQKIPKIVIKKLNARQTLSKN